MNRVCASATRPGRNGRGIFLLLVCTLLGFGCDRAPAPPPQTPAAVPAEPAVLVIGRQGRANGEFVAPRCIAIAPDDSFWIADETGRLQRFDKNAHWIGQDRVPATEKGKPWGLTVWTDGRLLVSDTHYHRIDVFDAGGILTTSWGSFGKAPGQFIYPVDVCVGPGGLLVVAEYGGADRLQFFDPKTFKLVRTVGSEGEAPGQFRRPSSVAWDARRKILYVADALNHRIQLFDADGKYLRSWGTEGRALGQMMYPYGIALDRAGRVWVAEFGNNRVQCWSPEGKPLLVWGGPGREPGKLHSPRDIGVDSRGFVYVTDEDNHRVQRFKPDLRAP